MMLKLYSHGSIVDYDLDWVLQGLAADEERTILFLFVDFGISPFYIEVFFVGLESLLVMIHWDYPVQTTTASAASTVAKWMLLFPSWKYILDFPTFYSQNRNLFLRILICL